MSYTEEEEVSDAWTRAIKGSSSKWSELGPYTKKQFLAFANALLAKREGTPIDRENVRAGDIVEGTIARQCSEFSRGGVVKGVVYQSGIGGLGVAGWPLNTLDDLRLIERPAPKLPTEPESLIEAYEVRGVKGKWKMMLDVDGGWNTHEKIDGYWGHYPESITKWNPADFVVREDQP